MPGPSIEVTLEAVYPDDDRPSSHPKPRLRAAASVIYMIHVVFLRPPIERH